MATQQYVILSCADAPADGGMAPIGSRREIVEQLSHYNTMPEREGEDILYGPGIRIELPPDEDPLRQMLLSVVEKDIAWLPIMRLAVAFRWKLFDPATGRELTPSEQDQNNSDG